MKTKIKLTSLLCFIFFLNVQSQRMDYTETETLELYIYEYLNPRDHPTKNRISELILLFLIVDSSGKISDVHMMIDEKNKRETYDAIKNITASAFAGWVNSKYKYQIIILPIESYGHTPAANYVEQLNSCPFFIPPGYVNHNIKTFVLAQSIYYLWPSNDDTPDIIAIKNEPVDSQRLEKLKYPRNFRTDSVTIPASRPAKPFH